MAPERTARAGGLSLPGMRNSALASAALTSVALLAQTANAAPSAGDEAPSRDEVRQRVSSLYDQAEFDTGTFNATRASGTAPRGRAGRPAGDGRGSSDPALDNVTRQWFDAARSKLGPTVPAALPRDRRPSGTAASRPSRPAERTGGGTADRGREVSGRTALELPAGSGTPARTGSVAELTSGPATGTAAVAELPAAPMNAATSATAALPVVPEAAREATRAAAPAAQPDRSALRTAKEQSRRKLLRAREVLSAYVAGQSTQLPAIGTRPTEDTWSGTTPATQPQPQPQPRSETEAAWQGLPTGQSWLSPASADAGPATPATPDWPAASTPATSAYGQSLATGTYGQGISTDAALLGGRATTGTSPVIPGAAPAATTGYGESIAAAATGYGRGPATGTTTYGQGVSTEAAAYGQDPATGTLTYGEAINTGATTHGQGINTQAAAYRQGPTTNPTTYGQGINTGATTHGQGINTQAAAYRQGPTTNPTTYGQGINTETAAYGQDPATGTLTYGEAINTGATTHGRGISTQAAYGQSPATGTGVGTYGQGIDVSPLTDSQPLRTVTAPAPAPAPAQDSRAEQAVAFARAQVGKPCVVGTTGPGSFDGAGLTLAAWKAAGITLPRTPQEQALAGRGVALADLEPGDLVLFHVGHVGVYTGNGQMIHAPGPGAFIREESIHYAGEAAIHSAIRPA